MNEKQAINAFNYLIFSEDIDCNNNKDYKNNFNLAKFYYVET